MAYRARLGPQLRLGSRSRRSVARTRQPLAREPTLLKIRALENKKIFHEGAYPFRPAFFLPAVSSSAHTVSALTRFPPLACSIPRVIAVVTEMHCFWSL